MGSKQPFGSGLARGVSLRIQVLQAGRGISMRQLAARIDVTHPYLSKRFGYAADFTLTDVERLAAELGTTPADLLADGQTYWDDFHKNRAAGTIPGEGQTWEEFSKWKLPPRTPRAHCKPR